MLVSISLQIRLLFPRSKRFKHTRETLLLFCRLKRVLESLMEKLFFDNNKTKNMPPRVS